MGIFDIKSKSQSEIRTDELIKRLAHYPSDKVNDLGDRLVNVTSHPYSAIMKPVYLYTDVIEMMLANVKDFMPTNYMQTLQYAEQIYKDIFVYEENTPGFEELAKMFIEFFDEDGVASRRAFDPTFFNLFKNKQNYLRWYNSVRFCQDIVKYNSLYTEYALEARCYFPDETTFTANVIDASIKIYNSANVQECLAQLKQRVAHMAGVYNVSEQRIMEAEQRLDGAEAMVKKASDILGIVNERLEMIDNVTKTSCDKVQQLCNTELISAKAELDGIDKKLNAAYQEFVAEEKYRLNMDREEFLRDVYEEAEHKLGEMKALSRTIISSASMELNRLNMNSSAALSKIDDYLKDDGRIAKIISDVNANKELMDKVDKLMVLNDRNLEHIINNVEDMTELKATEPVNINMTPVEGVASATIAAPTSVVPVEVNAVVIDDEELAPISYFFDENIPFAKRFEVAMEKKQKMVDKGVHFHRAFDDVLIAVMENSNPYLIGPSGCGKTYMIGQIAKILDLDFIDIGYINEEYDILGFQTANGGYSCPNFYRCYKHGKIAFLDELDNGNSRATVKLNSFLSNGDGASYSFPHGENVKRHANFRMVAAGNTAGNGADGNYNTREKIEESVQQRMMAIYVGYDNAVEREILAAYPNWFEFVCMFRNATDEWSNGNYSEAPGIITTRDVAKIKQYLDHQSFDKHRIIEYEFVETKAPDYLAFIADSLKSQLRDKSSCKDLVKIFCDRTEEIRGRR